MSSGKVTFHVVCHLDGLDWPVSFEFNVKELGDVEQKIKWLRERNFTPGIVVAPRDPPNTSQQAPPMPQHVAIPPTPDAPSYLPGHQVCPVHGGSMAQSKFEDDGWTSTHYCRRKTGEPNEYCKIRCGLDQNGALRWTNLPGQK